MRFGFVLIILSLWSSCHGQKEYYQWHFGLQCAVDFTGSAPLSHSNSAIYAGEGCASIADSDGNLLFYTNGVELWNKNHLTMANGASLAGNGSTGQSSFIAKKPSSQNLYYVFTLGTGALPILAYSVVDMSLAAGLGSVTVKNATLAAGLTEHMHGTLHCNGQDVWVAVHKWNTNEFNAFLLSASGISSVPVVSNAGGINYVGAFTMKFSPTGRKLCITNYDTLEVLDFNASTGQFSNPLYLAINDIGYIYGCEFSPDGTKVYTSHGGNSPKLHQWDLCAGSDSAIIASHYTEMISPIRSKQLGPGGKIYGTCPVPFGPYYLSAINNPNAQGSACNFVQNALAVNYGTLELGLPNLMSHSFRQKATVSHSVSCGLVSFSFMPPAYCAQTGYSVNSQQWIFGDPLSGTSNTSTLLNPTHTFPANGTYTVKLVANYDCYSDTTVQTVSVTALPNLTVTGKTSICKNESATFTVSGASTYQWAGGQTTSTLAVNPSTTTVYTVSGTSGSCQGSRSITLTVKPCTDIQEENSLTNLDIYPNPGDGRFTVESEAPLILKICNELGQEVASVNIETGRQVMDLSFLPAGVYFARDVKSNSRIKLLIY